MANRFAQTYEEQEEAGGNRFASAYRQRKPAPDYGAIWGDRAKAVALGAVDSFALGGADNLLDAGGSLFGQENAGQWLRDETDRAKRLDPVSFFAGNLAGGVALGGGAGLVGRAALRGAAAMPALASGANAVRATLNGAGPLSRIGMAGASGAVGGGIYGAASEDYGDRAGAAIKGAGLGFGLGAAGHGILGEALPRLAGAMHRGAVPEARAADILAETFRRHGVDDTTLDAAKARFQIGTRQIGTRPDGTPIETPVYHPDAMLMDALDGAGTDTVMGAAVRPSTERNAIRAQMDARNMGARERVQAGLWENLAGRPPSSAFETIEEAIQRQKKMASPLYEKAFDGMQPGNISQLARWKQLVRNRDPELYDQMEAQAMRLMTREGLNPAQKTNQGRLAHYIKLALDDHYQTATSKLNNGGLGSTEERTLFELMRLMKTGLDRSIPGYRQAAEVFAGEAAVKRAARLGYDLFGERTDSIALGEAMKKFRKMRGAEREAAETGVLNKLSEMMDSADSGTGRANALRAIMGDATKRKTLQAIFGGKARFDDLLRQLDQETALFNNTVNTGIRVNSITADKLAASRAQELPRTSGGLWDRAISVLSGPSREAYQEQVSDELIRLMRTPLADANGMLERANRGGLLAQARRRQQEIAQLRPRRSRGAIKGGLTAAVGFNPDQE